MLLGIQVLDTNTKKTGGKKLWTIKKPLTAGGPQASPQVCQEPPPSCKTIGYSCYDHAQKTWFAKGAKKGRPIHQPGPLVGPRFEPNPLVKYFAWEA